MWELFLGAFLVLACFFGLSLFLEEKDDLGEGQETTCSHCGSDRKPDEKQKEISETTSLREIEEESTGGLLVD
jgi:hypothetical protein